MKEEIVSSQGINQQNAENPVEELNAQDYKISPDADSDRKTSLRLSVNMNPETAAALRAIADRHGLSVTEAVRRVVAIASFVEQQQAEGKSVEVRDAKSGRVRELVLM
jgi:hypothetical protein